jgi:hypothetical protein
MHREKYNSSLDHDIVVNSKDGGARLPIVDLYRKIRL